mmetsp:Transcript_104156/g.321329  ORF Transcript_104156/g.321329 Transcript_104156/m.321329 type:complete len:208 (+) Transcript_104156:264-887(+)
MHPHALDGCKGGLAPFPHEGKPKTPAGRRESGGEASVRSTRGGRRRGPRARGARAEAGCHGHLSASSRRWSGSSCSGERGPSGGRVENGEEGTAQVRVAGGGAAAALAGGTARPGPPAPVPMRRDASRATSSYTFLNSESTCVSSSGSEKPSSMTSSAICALAISACISSMVLCISCTFKIWLASFIMAVDTFTALADDIVAIWVVK